VRFASVFAEAAVVEAAEAAEAERLARVLVPVAVEALAVQAELRVPELGGAR
jgi:hypothetical protein